jgi:hypothetical protein
MIYNPGIVVKKEPPISPPISPPIGGYTLIVTGGTPSSATQNSETTLLVTATIGTSYTVSYNVN